MANTQKIDIFSGTWTNPEYPDHTQNAELRLQFGENEELVEISLDASLELVGPQTPQSFLTSVDEAPRFIFGQSDHRKFSLYNSSRIEGTWAPIAYLVGQHLAYTDKKVKRLSVDVTNFEPWVSSVSEARAVYTEEFIQFTSRKRKNVFTQLTEFGTVALDYFVEMPIPDAFGAQLIPTLTLTIDFDDAVNLPRGLDLVQQICRLFVLLSGVPIVQQGAARLVLTDGGTAKFYRIRRGEFVRQKNHRPLVDFPGRVSALPNIISKWFSLSEKTREILGKLAEFLVKTEIDLEDDFLQICRVAESFCRALDDQGIVKVRRDGKRRNFEDCLKVLFIELVNEPRLGSVFACHDPQLKSPDGKLSESKIDDFLANVLWTRDELTHLLLDKPKEKGRLLGIKELRPTGRTIAFAAVCKAVRFLVPCPSATTDSLGSAYAETQWGRLNRLFD